MQNNSKRQRYSEGDLVTILVPLDTRVRDKKDNDALSTGTICHLYGEEVCVLLDGGDIWKGLARDIVEAESQKESEV